MHHNRKAHLAPQAPATAPKAAPPSPPPPATPPPSARLQPGAFDPETEDDLLSGEVSMRSQMRARAAKERSAETPGSRISLAADDPAFSPVSPLVALPSLSLPSLYDERGGLIVPAPLRGSHDILLHQNFMADADGLQRIKDDVVLAQMRASGALVPVPAGPGLRSDERLPANRRFCRPWTAQFLQAVAKAHYERFGTPLQVNSAVRTVQFQQRLLRRNANAAPAAGETASPHLTGQAVDLAKKGLSLAEIGWMRAYLLPLVQEGKIDVEEEFQQSCFHISIYRRYGSLVLAAGPNGHSIESGEQDRPAPVTGAAFVHSKTLSVLAAPLP